MNYLKKLKNNKEIIIAGEEDIEFCTNEKVIFLYHLT
jgi:hypothetical protein